MMRRGFWLTTGAVLGITGYRRATRLARSLTGQDRLALTRQRRPALVRRDRPAVSHQDHPALSRQEGQALADRDAAATSGQATALQRRDAALSAARSAIAGAAATAGFIQDVRAGMAEYWDLRREDSVRSLASRSDPAEPGKSQQGHRAP